MRPTEYEKRKKILPGQSSARGGRYVMNALASHQRPIGQKPLLTTPVDDPETRGVTKESCSSGQ